MDMIDRFVLAAEKYEFIKWIAVYENEFQVDSVKKGIHLFPLKRILIAVLSEVQPRLRRFDELLLGEDTISHLTGEDIDNYTLRKTENADLLNGSLFTVMYTSGSTGTPKGM